MYKMAAAVRAMLSTHRSEKMRRAAALLLNPVALKVGRPVTAQALSRACEETEKVIASVVAAEALEGVAAEALKAGNDENKNKNKNDENKNKNDDPPHIKRLKDFLETNEPWRDRVRRERVAAEVEAVEAATRELTDAIEADLVPHILKPEGNRAPKTQPCHLEHCQRNDALWLRHFKESTDEAKDRTVRLVHPRDRFGKKIADRWTSPRVEEALEAYRVAAAAAGRAVAGALRGLAAALTPHTADLVAAATFSTVVEAVSSHGEHAISRRWRPAELLPADDANTPWTARELIPFWMEHYDAVPNDLSVEGVVLLTGPNMAGKSTVLRSAAALALLASCGLRCPASRARVPFFDSLIVRMSSTDSPAQGLSSYAMEMVEVGQMLDVATPQSLVFIDELGRGTEAAHGTAMAGAVVEQLDKAGARGIFATHLHGLLDLTLVVSPYVHRMKMETALVPPAPHAPAGVGWSVDGIGGAGRVSPTWRMVPGECRESLALQTAVDMGVSGEVVRRSAALLAQLQSLGKPPPPPPRTPTAAAAAGRASSSSGGGGVGGGVGGRGRGGWGTSSSASSAPPLDTLRDMLRDMAMDAIQASTAPGAAGTRAWNLDHMVRASATSQTFPRPIRLASNPLCLPLVSLPS